MLEIDLLDPSLKNTQLIDELSIQVGADGFSFCMHAGKEKQVVAFRHYKFSNIVLEETILHSTAEILNKDKLLDVAVKNVRVVYSGRKSTLVPSEYLQEEHLKQILEFNHPLDELDEIHHTAIRGCSSYLVFALPTYFAGMITEKFRNAVFYNQAVPLLNYALGKTDKSGDDAVYIQLNKDFFDLVIIQNGTLSLYNSYLYVNPVDLLYFVLYVCKQLKIDTTSVPFYLSGNRSTERELTHELRGYIPHLHPVTKLSLAASTKLSVSERQRFFGLIHLFSCE